MKDYSKEEFYQMMEKIYFPKLPYRSLPKDYIEENNTDYSACRKCGGKCCQRCGCHFSPDDFEEISFEALKKEIEKGYISIVTVSGEQIYSNKDVYILRVRSRDTNVVNSGFSSYMPCILLGENGCKLSYDRRPTGGKLLVPHIETDKTGKIKTLCRQEYSLFNCCYEWLPHKKILHELKKFFADKEISPYSL